MCPRTAAVCLEINKAYGTKASNLGFLAKVLGRKSQSRTFSNKLGYDISPIGFGIPFSFYNDFVAANPELEHALNNMTSALKNDVIPQEELEGQLEALKDLFYKGDFPQDTLSAILKQLKTIKNIDSFKFRSSANAEDIVGFDGAGLYDSFAGKLSTQDAHKGEPCRVGESEEDGDAQVKPKTVECAIKAVYASLWNLRAVEERNFARLDHTTCVMGVAVLPTYKNLGEITANTVIVTRVDRNEGVPGYTISAQKDNILVTNPPKGTEAELAIVTTIPDADLSYSYIHFAKTDANQPRLNHPVVENKETLNTMVEIAQVVEMNYCMNKKGYSAEDCRAIAYIPGKKRSLDMEFKIYGERILCKQVREFNG
jgi:hypothetical protein